MKALIVIAMLFASTGYAFAPVAQQSDIEKIESTVWCVFQDKNLVDVYMAILWHESRYNHGAVGYNTDGSYDFGVAQLNSRYWNPAVRYYDTDIRTMRGNAYAGAKFFAALVDQFGGDTYDAVTAYNCGAGAVMYGLVPDCSRKYASRVLATAAMRRI